ncbi:MAG: Nif3-like dinuclear metal center hexameric protein [Gammaproteobacteria bacterium]|nr:Nif3-like dinuclear metal center hexameric protein [Gammaproteobacteria bacterium]
MILLNELVSYVDNLLDIENYQDYCPNGLQVEGKQEIEKLVVGVSANQELLDQAIGVKADAVLVHHGLFWKGEDPTIVGIKKQRLQTLLKHNISLLAYHLPLDFHELYGNNVQLAKVLGVNLKLLTLDYASGELPKAMEGEDFAQNIANCLEREPFYVKGQSKQIKTIAWCTGAADNQVEQVAAQGIDAYLTGEISERTIDIAKETGIHLFVVGHDTSERYGVKALGEHLASKFALEVIPSLPLA